MALFEQRIQGAGTLLTSVVSFTTTAQSVEVPTKGKALVNVLGFVVQCQGNANDVICLDEAAATDANGVTTVTGGTVTAFRPASGASGLTIKMVFIGQ